MKQTIIHITLPDKFPTGGPRTLFDLVSNIDRNRFHSIVIYPSGKFSDQLAPYAQISNQRIKKYPNLSNLRHLLKVLKQNPNGIIHIHHSNTLWIALFTKIFRKNKVIYTEHVLTSDYNPPNKLSYLIFKTQYTIYIKFVNQIICVSFAVKNYIQNYYHINKNKLTVIPNGIPISNKSFTQVKNTNKIFSITCVGALNWIKNYHDLIEITNILVNEYKIYNIHLNIIGDGDLKEKINTQISKYNLKMNVNLLGHIKLDEIYNVLKRTDLYVQTSLSESFGLGILDAMSFGIPIIAYDVGAINELVNKESGILIPFSNDKAKRISEFASQIKRLFENDRLRKSLSNEAIIQSKNYSIEKMIEKYTMLVEK